MSAEAAPSVDPRITFPSYKSFDEFIDVSLLKSLDGYVTERIEKRLAEQTDTPFYTGPFTMNEKAPVKPGSKMIYLSQPKGEDNYY
ncbi:MAG: hypothetical protein ABI883_07565, partial [Chthoniobacterales bacterium]